MHPRDKRSLQKRFYDRKESCQSYGDKISHKEGIAEDWKEIKEHKARIVNKGYCIES